MTWIILACASISFAASVLRASRRAVDGYVYLIESAALPPPRCAEAPAGRLSASREDAANTKRRSMEAPVWRRAEAGATDRRQLGDNNLGSEKPHAGLGSPVHPGRRWIVRGEGSRSRCRKDWASSPVSAQITGWPAGLMPNRGVADMRDCPWRVVQQRSRESPCTRAAWRCSHRNQRRECAPRRPSWRAP